MSWTCCVKPVGVLNSNGYFYCASCGNLWAPESKFTVKVSKMCTECQGKGVYSSGIKYGNKCEGCQGSGKECDG